MVLALAQILDFQILTVDVKSAYMQSGPIHREPYVKPPNHLDLNGDSVWKLKKLPCGIVEAGRQWQCAAKNCLLSNFKGTQVAGTEQLSY